MELRSTCLLIWQLTDPTEKYIKLKQLHEPNNLNLNLNLLHIDEIIELNTSLDTAGIPQSTKYAHHTQVKKRNINTHDGKINMLHALAHIEFNAINLALDAIWRFANMPKNYYLDWLKVAYEESIHFTLLNTYLQKLGMNYTDIVVHRGLWNMAIKTKHNLLARLAMVPRTLEARGLDMAPMIYQKLIDANDTEGAEILARILHDELEHVLIGNKWYEYLCHEKNIDPSAHYEQLILEYDAPKPSKPINQLGRLNSGFYPHEIEKLCNITGIAFEL
jgi:uncharacterized ferritin-like protein (DUF455 family)